MRRPLSPKSILWDNSVLTVEYDSRNEAWLFTSFGSEPAVVLNRYQLSALVVALLATLEVSVH